MSGAQAWPATAERRLRLPADAPGHTPDGELRSVADAVHWMKSASFTDGATGQVGLEIEAHCYDLADPHRRPDWAQLQAALAGVDPLPGGSRITVEPGGAVELSGPPLPGPLAAIDAMRADRQALAGALHTAGLGLVLLGADPLRRPQRVNPGARYAAMERFFAAAGTAAAGAAMMTATASVQVNLDAGPRSGWADRVRLAHALGPVMIALTANSPMLGGRFSGWRSTRQHVWGELDSARCGPVLGFGDDPVAEWARYALTAPVMMVPGPEPQPVLRRVPFADWVDGSELLGGRRPTAADLDYHLTTLFPPVRPRRWLEIRYLDAVPDALWPAVVFTLTTLLDDPGAAAIAHAATAEVATAWDTAAQSGLSDRRLREAARICLDAVAERAPAALADGLGELDRIVDTGASPGDAFAEHAVAAGVDAAVLALAGDGR